MKKTFVVHCCVCHVILQLDVKLVVFLATVHILVAPNAKKYKLEV